MNTKEPEKKKEEFCMQCLAAPALAGAVAAAGVVTQTGNSDESKNVKYILMAVAGLSIVAVVCLLRSSRKKSRRR
tara:strand:+ start:246 stop:470 length:225 start_codon:yes stop_codon:yes gene_type:complete